MANDNQDTHPLEGFMHLTMDNLKQLIEVDTAVGQPINVPDGSMIIPLSKVKYGFAAAGSEFMPKGGQGQDQDQGQDENQSESIIPFGGGSGGGVSITPAAFIVAGRDGVELISLNDTSRSYQKLIEKSPEVIDQVLSMLKQKKEDNNI
ncbi:GerW family sporulation protein [Gracilibacillus sp. S3-1-1]|uniref:GerW family sporulation protein n=1 Tax=Gracilibacillus pellucidus TaxID=3095368 RepID=A0ACC6M768_9BACI|nr:GerW family sporulation protein [Gracilibacillus sp. S3-1-1]MDX8046721.1 GerW family sporulation protein [Gracilibacillus sp. S3-1-1]